MMKGPIGRKCVACVILSADLVAGSALCQAITGELYAFLRRHISLVWAELKPCSFDNVFEVVNQCSYMSIFLKGVHTSFPCPYREHIVATSANSFPLSKTAVTELGVKVCSPWLTTIEPNQKPHR
jgi:hypothetical protein